MKILWLSHIVPYPPKAGVLQRCYNMLNECSKYHEIDLLTFVQNGVFDQVFNDRQKGIDESYSFLKTICRRVEYVEIESEKNKLGRYSLAFKSLFTKNPYTINWLESKNFRNLLLKWTGDTDYDLIFFDTISLALYLDDVKGKPTILDHHNIESHLLLRRADLEKNPIKKYYYHQEGSRLQEYEKEFCKKFSLNITCSEMDSARLAEIDKNIKTVSVPNGVSLRDNDKLPKRVNNKSIIFVGTLNWDPNAKAVVYLVQNIWPLLKEKIPEVTCDIIGAGPPKELVELAKKDSTFKVHGFVSDLDDYLVPGSVFVCPIKDGGGTKLKVLDALAIKAAVVADPIACEGIGVTNEIDVLLSSTPEEYVENIQKLFTDNELRTKLGENAHKLIKDNYSYESIGQDFSTLCKKVAKYNYEN